MSDITQYILEEHAWFRRTFALLDELDDDFRAARLWRVIEQRLEVHALAEEAHFYPTLLQQGDNAREESKDALGDHNKIRAAAHRTNDLRPGTADWWSAVRDARAENSDHMAEEERNALPDFKRNTTHEQRRELGVEFTLFTADRTEIDVSESFAGPDVDDFIAKYSP